jgi:hypothetical protein
MDLAPGRRLGQQTVRRSIAQGIEETMKTGLARIKGWSSVLVLVPLLNRTPTTGERLKIAALVFPPSQPPLTTALMNAGSSPITHKKWRTRAKAAGMITAHACRAPC